MCESGTLKADTLNRWREWFQAKKRKHRNDDKHQPEESRRFQKDADGELLTHTHTVSNLLIVELVHLLLTSWMHLSLYLFDEFNTHSYLGDDEDFMDFDEAKVICKKTNSSGFVRNPLVRMSTENHNDNIENGYGWFQIIDERIAIIDERIVMMK